MAEVGTAFVSVIPSARGFGGKLQSQVGPQVDAEGKRIGSRFGGAIGTAAKVGLAVGGIALIGFGKAVIGAASDAQQSIGATETVFGKFADTVVKTSDGAAQAYGLSANTYRESANLIGSLFKNQGVATDELAGKTEQMIGVGADLAATFGGTTTEAVQTLGAAFKGEYDSIERYGISLKESTVSAELAKRGQENLTGAQLAAAKQAVVTDLIMQQSKDSLGAFGRESNTLAGQQQRLGAQFENFKVLLGTALLPVLTQFIGFMNASVVPAITGFVTGMRDGTGAGGAFASVLTTIGSAVASVVGFVVQNKTAFLALGVTIAAVTLVVQAHAAALAIAAAGGLLKYLATTKLVTTATKVWAAVQWVLNAALTANPIGLVIVAVAALVAGVIIAYKRSETFRAVVQKVWAALKSFAGVLSGAVAVGLRLVIGFVGDLIGRVQTMVGWVRDKAGAAWVAMKDKAIDAAQAILGPVQSVIDKVQAAVDKVRTAGSVWGGLKTAAVSAVNAIASAVQSVIDNVQALINKIQSIPGIPGGGAAGNGTVTDLGPLAPRTSTPIVPDTSGLAGNSKNSSVISELQALRAAVLTVAPGVGSELNTAGGNAARRR